MRITKRRSSVVSEPKTLKNGITIHHDKTKSLMKESWKTRHSYHNRQDGLHQMDRTCQTTLFRLRTGHNRLKAHLYKTYKIGYTDLCSCGEAAETVKHVLQDCQNYRMFRQAAWSIRTDLQTKLWGKIE
ncbi:hypothetical protein ElyMa_000680800 [Elysia marginata]|uniref:Reverse transcriptase zinc-binding domain-containing protein n=1 Tax=Elysia marginata TaxID=1093978 RepID=A0AAV4GID7_9GAST|nr:hypothetical protein ElyMa_000680800 [Elysia marginata]